IRDATVTGVQTCALPISACGTESLGIAEVELGSPQTPTRDSVPVSEYIRGTFVPLSNLAQGWQLHAAVSLTPAEERTMVREPARSEERRVGKEGRASERT